MTTVEQLVCGCGKEVSTTRAMTMHRTSKVHKSWEENQVSPEAPSTEMDETLVAALVVARSGDDPRSVAKMVRSVFNRLDWPDDSHPGSVADWLKEHNIPILTTPPHIDPDEFRKNIDGQLRQFKADGYGTEGWEIKE
jgi:hypothetical protein